MSDDKAHLETLRFLVRTHRDEFERRRAYEWKCVLAGVTFLALVIAFSGREEATAVRSLLPVWVFWCILLGIWGAGSAFLAYAHVAHAVNKEVAHRAEAAIQRCVNGESYLPLSLYEKLPSRPTLRGSVGVGSGGFWGWLWESIILFLFTLCAAITIAG